MGMKTPCFWCIYFSVGSAEIYCDGLHKILSSIIRARLQIPLALDQESHYPQCKSPFESWKSSEVWTSNYQNSSANVVIAEVDSGSHPGRESWLGRVVSTYRVKTKKASILYIILSCSVICFGLIQCELWSQLCGWYSFHLGIDLHITLSLKTI